MFTMSDTTTPLSPTEGPGRAHSTGDSTDVDELRVMIEAMKADFTRELTNVKHRAEFAEMRAAKFESELELTGAAGGASNVTRRTSKETTGGATGGARQKSTYWHGPTRSESEIEREKAMSEAGHMTGGTHVPTSAFPPTPNGSTMGPSGHVGSHRGGHSQTPSQTPKKGRRSAVATLMGRFSEEDAQLFDAPEISEMGLDYVCEDNNLISEVRKQERVAAMHLETTASVSVKRRAIDTPEFTGDSDFTRWFNMFAQDCAANGWSEEECYTTLRVKIRNGPARIALALGRFDSTGDGDYYSLVRALTVACGAEDVDLRWQIGRAHV